VAPRGHLAVDAHDASVGREPDEIECEAHAERVDGAAAPDAQRALGVEVLQAGEPAAACAQPVGLVHA
jgi:hypothetical protein